MLALLFRTIETFKIFDVVYILTEGGPGSSTETVSVYVYRLAFQFFRTSLASALGYIMLFAVIVLTSLYLYAIQTRRAEPVNEYSATLTSSGDRAGGARSARPSSARSTSSPSIISS